MVGRDDRADNATLQLPEPQHRSGLEDTGWSRDTGDMEQLAGAASRAVMDERTSPQGQGEGAGLCFSRGEAQEAETRVGGQNCAGLPPSYSWSTLQHTGGPGGRFPPRRAQGGCAACRTEQSSNEPAESKREPCALQGLYLDPVQHGKDWDGALGTGTGSAAPRQEAAFPKASVLRGAGEERCPRGTDPGARHGWPG